MTRHPLARIAAVVALAALIAAPASAARSRQRSHAHTFSFLARVVRSSSAGLLVAKTNGKKLWFAASEISHHAASAKPRHHHRHARVQTHGPRRDARAADAGQPSTTPAVTVNIVGLQPGVTVQITETIAANGDITITITLPPSTGEEQSASGVVTEVDTADFILDPGDGTQLQLNMDPDALADLDLSECDEVDATYHQDAGVLVADHVEITGSSTSGDCAPTDDVDGTITQVSANALTIQSDEGPMSFSVDSSDITDGFSAGDVVDVTYTDQGDGSLDAVDVEYVEDDDTGIVTAVTATRLTIADSVTGEPDVFVADPDGIELDSDAFTGVSMGDDIDVCFHTTAAGLVADTVTDPLDSGDDN
jgi:hypothetical protein